MAELFISRLNSKQKVHEFVIYCYEEALFRFSIGIYNGLFVNYSKLFRKTARLDQFEPSRAQLNTSKFFTIYFTPTDGLMLPVNIPPLNEIAASNQPFDRMKKELISYASNDNLNLKNNFLNGYNRYQSNALFWKDTLNFNIPYLPFFSNCNGYGKYIPLWLLLEQDKGCSPVSEEETKFISDFSFGASANGDGCEVELQCFFDEPFNEKSNLTFWYSAEAGTRLFSISRRPVTMDDINTAFPSSNLIDVTLSSDSLQPGTVPSEIQLDITYFQESPTTKSLVSAEISFSNPVPTPEEEKLGYTFKVNYKALSHKELMVAFALSYTFYIVLYVIQGTIALIIVTIFLIYHILMSRTEKKVTFKFFPYLQIMFPPAFYGFLVATIPIWVVILTIGLFMSNSLFIFKVSMTVCNDGEVCNNFLIDALPYNEELDKTTISHSRTVICLLALGCYLTFRGVALIVPKKKQFHAYSYDYNVWSYFTWKRTNFLFFTVIMMFVFFVFAFLSFQSIFENNLFYFMYTIKIVGILFEQMVEAFFDDTFVSTTVALCFAIFGQLVTFGSSTLIDFLISFFIELGSQMIERTYVDDLLDFVKDKLSSSYRSIKRLIKKYLMNKIDDEKTNQEEEEEDRDDVSDSEASSSSEEEQVEEENISEEEHSERIDEILKRKQLEEYEGQGREERELEPLMDSYKGYSADLLSYFFNVSFYAMLWAFYQQTQIIFNYGIAESNFIFFFYFTLVIIPFSMVIDVLFNNLIEYHNGICILDMMDYMQFKFSTRKVRWLEHDNRVNKEISDGNKLMDKYCFSSQYYFIYSIYISGVFLVLVAIVALQLKDYNIFSDTASMPLMAATIAVCYLVELSSVYLGDKMGIWNTNLVEEANNDNGEEEIKLDRPEIKPISGWDKIKLIKREEEFVEHNIRSEAIQLSEVKEKFLAENKDWLREVITEVISPRTLMINKEKIIEQLEDKLPRDLEKLYNEIDKQNEEGVLLKVKHKKILAIWRRRAKQAANLKRLAAFALASAKKGICSICGEKKVTTFQVKTKAIEFYYKHRNFILDDIDFKKLYLEKAEYEEICATCDI